MYLVVDGDSRSQTAGPEAAGHLEREHAVLGGLAHVDAQLLADGVEHLQAATHVAGGAQADTDEVLASRHGGEERVEAHDSGDLAVGLAEAQSDALERDFGKVPEDALGQLKHGDQAPGLAFVALDDLIEPGKKLLFGGFFAARAATSLFLTVLGHTHDSLVGCCLFQMELGQTRSRLARRGPQ